MKLLSVAISLVAVTVALPQPISNEEAISKAREYVARIGVQPGDREPAVYAHPMADAIIVSLDGFVTVRMNPDGSFRMFTDGRRRDPSVVVTAFSKR